MSVHMPRPVRAVLLALWLAVAACALALMFYPAAASADPVCSTGRSTLESIMSQVEGFDGKPGYGTVLNRLSRAPDGMDVLSIVYEKQQVAGMFVFKDNCLLIARQDLPAAEVLKTIFNKTWEQAFPDSGI